MSCGISNNIIQPGDKAKIAFVMSGPHYKERRHECVSSVCHVTQRSDIAFPILFDAEYEDYGYFVLAKGQKWKVKLLEEVFGKDFRPILTAKEKKISWMNQNNLVIDHGGNKPELFHKGIYGQEVDFGWMACHTSIVEAGIQSLTEDKYEGKRLKDVIDNGLSQVKEEISKKLDEVIEINNATGKANLPHGLWMRNFGDWREDSGTVAHLLGINLSGNDGLSGTLSVDSNMIRETFLKKVDKRYKGSSLSKTRMSLDNLTNGLIECGLLVFLMGELHRPIAGSIYGRQVQDLAVVRAVNKAEAKLIERIEQRYEE